MTSPTLNDAFALYQQGKLTEAKAICRQLSANQPNNFNAFQLLGLVQLKQNNPIGAEKALTTAIHLARQQQLQPRFIAQALNLQALALEQRKQLDKAVEAWDEAIQLNPNELAFRLNQANLLDLNYQPEPLLSRTAASALQQYPELMLMRLRALRRCESLSSQQEREQLAQSTLSQIEAALLPEALGEWISASHADSAWSELEAPLQQHFNLELNAELIEATADYLAEENCHTAALHGYQYLLQHIPDHPMAAHLINASRGVIEESCPTAYVTSLYNTHAQAFEQRLTKALGYDAPKRLLKALTQHVALNLKTIADLGCGTGLCGEQLRKNWPDATLYGVDLSEQMLAIADRKAIYNHLECADLMSFLAAHPNRFDLITATDVLIYLGDLSALIAQTAAALKPQGIFAFTTEKGDKEITLTSCGRYQHSREHIVQHLEADQRFTVLSCEAFPLRRESGQWQEGWMVIAQKN